MNVLILGGNGGIGRAIIDEILLRHPTANIFATWHSKKPVYRQESQTISEDTNIALNFQWFSVDVSSESEIKALSAKVRDALLVRENKDRDRDSDEKETKSLALDWIINAVGVLHVNNASPEKSIRQVEPDFFIKNIEFNTLPTLLLAKHFASLIKKSSAPVFTTVSAKVGSIDDNHLGGWTSYRCSKAALNMALKNISLEWRRSIPKACVVALHPGTTDTELSMPFQSGVAEGRLFSPQKTARYLLDVVASLTPEKTGKFFSWDGTEIPW